MRTIRELMPGNVTRHFGIQSWNRRHWVTTPQPLAQVQVQAVDITAAYRAVLTARFTDPGTPAREILLYRPQVVALDAPPQAVRDATTSSPRWGVQLHALGTGRVSQLTRGRWRKDHLAARFPHPWDGRRNPHPPLCHRGGRILV